jgi:hypothetical protein
MKKITTLLSLSFLLIIQACGPSTYITGSWKKPEYVPGSKDYKKLFIGVMAQDLGFRDNLEKDIAAAAQKRGLQTSLSLDVFPPQMTKSQLPPKEDVQRIIEKTGSDVVMIVAIKDIKDETRYVPGTTTYAPYGYGGYYGYYGGGMAYSYSPGYYTTDRTIYLETNIYDLKTDDLIWSAQSQSVNPSDFRTFSREFIYAVLNQLKKDGMLRPTPEDVKQPK